MPCKDYYGVLGVPRDAGEDDIKRAYRKMAIKWHPDKNPDNKEEATIKFKEIAEAYEILSDPEKRRLVDSRVDPNDQTAPSASRRSGARYTTHDPFEVFNAFFGGRDPFADFFGDAFGSPFGRMSSGQGSGRGSHRGGFGMFSGSLFDDDDFFGGFGSMGSFGRMGSGSMFMSSTMGSGLGGMSGRTVTTTTQVVNGQKVTRKVTQVTNPDGSVQETVEESTQGPNGQLRNTANSRTIAAGQQGHSSRNLTMGTGDHTPGRQSQGTHRKRSTTPS
eukprot:EG_transcript_23252